MDNCPRARCPLLGSQSLNQPERLNQPEPLVALTLTTNGNTVERHGVEVSHAG